MRKLTNHPLKILIVGLLILCIGSCTGEHGNEKYLKQIKELQQEIEELREELGYNPRDVSKPRQIISLEDATELYESYTTNRACVIKAYEAGKGNIREICPTDRKPKELIPARSAFISHKVLKQYLAYVKQETKKREVDITGFRFYFSNYPDKEKFNDGRKIKDPRRNTFFAAPTIKKGSEDLGFTIFEKNDGSFEIRILEDFFGNIDKGSQQSSLNKAGFAFFSQENFEEISFNINDVGSHP